MLRYTVCPVRHPVLHRDGKTSIVSNPTDFPEPADFASGGRAKAVQEPIVKASIIVPESQYHLAISSTSSFLFPVAHDCFSRTPLLLFTASHRADPTAPFDRVFQRDDGARVRAPWDGPGLATARCGRGGFRGRPRAHACDFAPGRDRHRLFRQTQKPQLGLCQL